MMLEAEKRSHNLVIVWFVVDGGKTVASDDIWCSWDSSLLFDHLVL
jgi:hypothetical protein